MGRGHLGRDALVAVTAAERPDLAERGDALAGRVWPEYNLHGDVLNRYWGELLSAFPAFQVALYDEAEDDVVAFGNTIPIAWDGTADGLPPGIDGAIESGVALGRDGGRPDAVTALAAMVAPGHQGRGLSRVVLEAMAGIAAAHGLGALVAPVRPTLKERYPLTPIERFAAWRRDDGLPLDPWLRVHARMGASILRPEPRSLRVTGTVAEWESWTELAFPESGSYVFPRGLAPVEIDREADAGRYWEPNVWMLHEVRT